jgi:hypothetical protein
MEGPLCDTKCRKEKQLAGLSTALKNTEATKDSNPEAYTQARTNFYTIKEGPGWASKEKQKVGREQADPLLQQYQEKYNSLKQQLDQSTPGDPHSEEVGDEAETRFIMKQIGMERNEADVARRLVQLQADPSTTPISAPSWMPSWMPWILNLATVVLILGILYFVIVNKKYERVTGMFSSSTPPIN